MNYRLYAQIFNVHFAVSSLKFAPSQDGRSAAFNQMRVHA